MFVIINISSKSILRLIFILCIMWLGDVMLINIVLMSNNLSGCNG